MVFKEVYKLPFKVVIDGMCAISSNGVKTFTAFDSASQGELKRIIDVLNGGSNYRYDKKSIKVEKDIIYIGKNIILVRGWGYLTGQGIGGLGMKPNDAAKLQDDFIKWIVDTISEDLESFEAPL